MPAFSELIRLKYSIYFLEIQYVNFHYMLMRNPDFPVILVRNETHFIQEDFSLHYTCSQAAEIRHRRRRVDVVGQRQFPVILSQKIFRHLTR
jgi:hypothetical protein